MNVSCSTGSDAAGNGAGPCFWVALMHPDIPQNAGNIGRTCVAAGGGLILVRPLGFRLTDALLKRAGMDYWEKLQPIILDSDADFSAWCCRRRVWWLSVRGAVDYDRIEYQRGDVFVLGSETQGLPEQMRAEAESAGRLLRIPMAGEARCLNQASAAAVVVFEACRQLRAARR